ncbi:hypothetical protein LEP1GSC132_3319 [Leptospira kirschneri str. 200803703]|nr:hypothetical protein LEP1GSC198_3593 [Leptospira kirschneri str. JB]EMO67451.1 hypothetical protein LEP1GSC132_3319 [Leptospira kirschneri str. 200803703]
MYLLFEYKSYLDNLIELVKKFIFTNDFIHLFLFHGNNFVDLNYGILQQLYL